VNLYRLLTGPDDASFCHKVTDALNKGWSLYGSPSITWDPEQKRTVCAQAVVKEAHGETYRPDMKLSER
jgi:hypothetical protein